MQDDDYESVLLEIGRRKGTSKPKNPISGPQAIFINMFFFSGMKRTYSCSVLYRFCLISRKPKSGWPEPSNTDDSEAQRARLAPNGGHTALLHERACMKRRACPSPGFAVVF